jgi:hypothetical protein
MLGLIDRNVAASFGHDPMKVDYGLVVGGQSLMIYEKGICKGTFGYKPGDRLAVVVLHGMVTYRKMGTVLRQAPPTPNVPLQVVALFQGKGAKATELTILEEVVNYQETTIPIEYTGTEARGAYIKGLITEYERPFTIVVRRPPAASILERATRWAEWASDNILGATEELKTEEERKLRQSQDDLTDIDSEMAALQELDTEYLSPWQKCWSWWVDKLKGSGSNSGVLTLIEKEIEEHGQKLQDGRLPSLEQMGYKVSPTLELLSPASQAYSDKAGSYLTCGKQHLHTFSHLWQGSPPQKRPSVMIPNLEKWNQFLEFEIPRFVEKKSATIAGYLPYYFVEVGDLELTDRLFHTESGDGDDGKHKTVLQKHKRIEDIHREVNDGPYCIATQIGTEGEKANTMGKNYKAWDADVSQVKSKKDDLDARRAKRGVDYRKCTGHAVLFPSNSNGPSDYSVKPQPTLLKYLSSKVKIHKNYRTNNKINVDKVWGVEKDIRRETEDMEKKEELLKEKTETLTKAIDQSKGDSRLLKTSSQTLKSMKTLKLKYEAGLVKSNDETAEEDKQLTKKNDQYKTKVAELKQKNIDDLTCGCLYKYIDIATALLYMGITRCLAKALACTAYDSEDPNSEAHLIAIPDIECWTGDHCFMAPAAVLGLCALYPTAMLTRPLFQALDEKLEFHFDYDYLFVFSQLQTFLLVASSFFPNTKEVLLLLCLFVDLVLLRFFMTPSSTDAQRSANFFELAHLSSNKKTVRTAAIEAHEKGSFLENGKGGKIVQIIPRKPGDIKGDGTLVLEFERKSFLLPRSAENFVNNKLIQRRNRQLNQIVEQAAAVSNPLSTVEQHYEADPPAVNQRYEVSLMAYDLPLLMAEREETSMMAEQHDDDGARRETRTETVAHNLESHRTNSVGGDQDGEQSAEERQGSTAEIIRSGACTAQPINKIAIVAFGFSAW